jgi:hypothetical protein
MRTACSRDKQWHPFSAAADSGAATAQVSGIEVQLVQATPYVSKPVPGPPLSIKQADVVKWLNSATAVVAAAQSTTLDASRSAAAARTTAQHPAAPSDASGASLFIAACLQPAIVVALASHIHSSTLPVPQVEGGQGTVGRLISCIHIMVKALD